MSYHDGLKYMNIRPNLMALLEEKKRRSQKVAEKVTQVEPFNGKGEKLCIVGDGFKGKVAGRVIKRRESAKELIYSDW